MLIRTPEGDRRVETLQPGDLVCTLDRGAQPILWIWGRRVSYRDMRRYKGLRPFLVGANSFGSGQPFCDTWFSCQHRIVLSRPMFKQAVIGKAGVLAPVHALAALKGIDEGCPTAGIGYFHILTREHNLIWSNGLVTETLLLTGHSSALMWGGQGDIVMFPRGLAPVPVLPARLILENRHARKIARHVGRSGKRALQAADPI